MSLIQFYEQLNEANDIIKNIKLPTDYMTKPKPSFYLPSNIMANIMSYLPTPLDHHKKKMKIVNEDFEIIKEYYYCYTSYDTGELYWYLDYKGNNRRLRKSPKRRGEYLSIKSRFDMEIENHRAWKNGTYEYIP